MRYSDDIIEEVRERTDIVALISGYVKLTRKGNSYFGLCPFHSEKTGSFSVSPNKQMYYCFGCGAGGNAYTFLMQYENYSFQEAVSSLAERAGMRLPEPESSRADRARSERRDALLQIQKEAAEYYVHKLISPTGAKALAYLRGRGLSDQTMLHFGLGYSDKYSSDLYRHLKEKGYADELLRDTGLFHFDEKNGATDKFWNRVMFPIMDANSRVIGFGGRVLGDAQPKYLNSPETMIFDKSRNLYGLHVARRTREKNLILCEGYMDVISMHQAGFTNAVASLGTALTGQQCQLLSRFTKEVLMIYDMDDAGKRAAQRGIPLLREAGISARVVDLGPHKDPDEFLRAEGEEAFRERLGAAENGFLFLVRMASQEYERSDPAGNTAFLHRMAEMLTDIPDEIERASYVNSCAKLYHTDAELLRREIGRLSLRGTGRRIPDPPRNLYTRKEQKAAGNTDKSQKLMLTWLADRPSLIGDLDGLLGPEDFTNPLCRESAGLLWEQARAGEVHPASVIDHFPDEEDQSEVAAMFHTVLGQETEEIELPAFFEVLCRIRREALELRMSALDPLDLGQMAEMGKEKKKLEQMQRDGPPSVLLQAFKKE